MPAPVSTKSPIGLVFHRQGGADIQAEIQIWIKKANYTPSDRPVQRVGFSNPLMAQEAQSVLLPPGAYVCVILGMAREALNGVFVAQLNIGGKKVFSKQGDANVSPKPNETANFRADFELAVTQ